MAQTASGPTLVYVYCGTVSGGPDSKINSALVVGTTYTDSNVQAGKNYFYVTTALNGSGTESAYSNQVQAVVPSRKNSGFALRYEPKFDAGTSMLSS